VDINFKNSTDVQILTKFAENMATRYNATGQWEYSDYCASGWVTLPGSLKTISSNNLQLWGSNNANQIYRYDGKKWELMGSGYKQIAVCPNGSVHALDNAGKIYSLTNNQWQIMAGTLTTIACGMDGIDFNGLWGVDTGGVVLYYNRATSTWVSTSQLLNPTIGSISIGLGRAWGIDLNHRIVSLVARGSTWTTIPTPDKILAVTAGDGGVFGISSNSNVLFWDGTQWIAKASDLKQITVNDRFLYGVKSTGEIVQRTLSTM
jgi:hypothetical protein